MADGHPTHADLMRQVEANGHQAAQIYQSLNARMADLFQLVENVEVKVYSVDERVQRVEAKVLKYDLMGARIMGALGALAVGASALWWFVHDKVAKLLGADG